MYYLFLLDLCPTDYDSLDDPVHILFSKCLNTYASLIRVLDIVSQAIINNMSFTSSDRPASIHK